ncbi:MAG TPA: hypothetical protein VIW24_10720 [Aldersonia sp.]
MTTPVFDESTLRSLSALADSGDLRLADDVASACVNACTTLIEELRLLMHGSRYMSSRDAYGILASAQQLGAKFEAKAIGPGGFQDVVLQHIDTVTQLRDLFEKAGRAYRDADERAADMIATRTEGR